MLRYLLNVSYIGTSFKGVQRQITGSNCRPDDPYTVQGIIEMGLKNLRSLNTPCVVISSRTDSGVHCISSTMHVDLQHPKNFYEPEVITVTLNKFFNKRNVPVRVLKTYLVPDTFHSRYNAISRTYMYKLAVVKTNKYINLLTQHIPIEDFHRCLYISANEFDLKKANEATKLFEGPHDFRSFMGRASHYPEKVTRRVIESLDIFERMPDLINPYSRPTCIDSDLNYQYYEIKIKASGFLYKQVRRTVASLIAVAKGIVTPKDIKLMIEIPSHLSWNPRIKTVPAHGLYLCEVAYRKEDLQTFKKKL